MTSVAAKYTFLVLGATGATGKHFVDLCLKDGHRVRALVRSPQKLTNSAALDVRQGSITDAAIDTDDLVKDVDFVVAMIGDREVQRTTKIARAFVEKLVPSMRQAGVRRFLYQAGAMSCPYGGSLGWVLWLLRQTIGRSYDGQHKDNESVMEYLATQANDIDWVVHLAGLYGEGTKGTLVRSPTSYSIGTFGDCAQYSYTLMTDPTAVRTSHYSHYQS